MDPVDFLKMSGGVAGRDLLAASGRRAVRRALEAGLVVRVGRARFSLPVVARSLGVAHGLSGVLSHAGAARFWGWEVSVPLAEVDVIVPRDRRPRPTPGAVVRRRDLVAGDVAAPGVTTPLRTVLDVSADLAFADALAIADSALRSGLVGSDELIAAASASPGRGRARRLRVARTADARADNPFESALRALSLEAGLAVVPQISLFTGDRWVRPDLLDEGRGLAIEAESFTWHGNREQLMRDCHKYNDLSLMGLFVVRFAWEQVMVDRAYARAVLRACATGGTPWRGAAATHPTTHAA
jgi:hypothetical protein